MNFFSLLPSWVRNKYFITLLAFVVWMVFFDRNDIPYQLKRINELKQLEQSEKNMDTQINDTKKELELLKSNPSTLEKYAREKYMMKRDNEDLFIVNNGSNMTK
ncbi:MAG: septum formation initiator family protein [Ginsengibacter sp.]